MSYNHKHLALVGAVLAFGTMLQAQQLDPTAQLLISNLANLAPARDQDAANRTISVYVKYDIDHTDWQALEALDCHVGICTNGFATVRLPLSQLNALSQVEGIQYVQAPQEARQMLDLARKDALADEAQAYTPSAVAASVNPRSAWNPGNGSALNYTGQGIIIGLVDAGFDYMHNAFRAPDGELRIKRVWEQFTDPATAPIPNLHSPEAFGYGAEFDNAVLIKKAGGDTNAGSHGTHVMGIAAGSDTYLDGQFRGVAPDAELVMVAYNDEGPDNVHVSEAIKYIFDYADSVNKPCVINLSVGSNLGPHDGTSPFDQIIDALQGPGRLIVGAAGNYGPEKIHISRYFSEEESDDESFKAIIFHEFYTSFQYGDVDIWANESLNFSFELFDYNTALGTESESTILTLAELLDGQVHDVDLGRNMTGKIQLSAEVNPLNGKTHILLHSQLTNNRKNHEVALRVKHEGGYGKIDLWADDNKMHFNAEREGFITPTTEGTITEVGSTSHRILGVGSYTTRDQFQIEDDDTWHPIGMDLNHLSIYSGSGPTADGRQKPEVCAPGSVIISAVSSLDVTSPLLHSHYTDANGRQHPYGYMQGTSMATPFVTGAVALWLQAYPELTPEELKEVIAASSRMDDFTTEERYWGAGKINVLEGLKRCIELEGNNAIQQVVEPADGELFYYDASGRRVLEPQQHGFYIIKAGKHSQKISLH